MSNLVKLFGSGIKAGTPVFVDNFSVAKAAPLGSPLPADTLGQWTVTDTENKLSISDGKLNFAPKATPSYSDPRVFTNIPTTKVSGTAIVLRAAVTGAGIICAGFGDNATSAPSRVCVRKYEASVGCMVNGSTVVSGIATTDTDIALITENLCFFFGRTSGVWKILYLFPVAYNTVYCGFVPHNATGTIDVLKVVTLPAPFNTDYGTAVQTILGAVPNGSTFVHNPNAGIGATFTTLANSQQVVFRRQDATNYWTINVAADGSIALAEVVAGVSVNRDTRPAGTIANGQWLGIIADGAVIRVFTNNTLRITYSSATNFQTATAGIVNIGTGAISDLASWPIELTGRAKKILDEVAR